MHAYTAVIERCPDTNLYIGHVPGFPGAHSQGASLDELHANLREVIIMLVDAFIQRAQLNCAARAHKSPEPRIAP